MTLKNIIEKVEKAIKKLLFVDGQIAITSVNDVEEEKTTLTAHCFNIDGELTHMFDVVIYYSANDGKYTFSTITNINFMDKTNLTEVSNMYTLSDFISVYVLDEDMTEYDEKEEEVELLKSNIKDLNTLLDEKEDELQATINELEDTQAKLEEVLEDKEDIEYKLDNIKGLIDDIYSSVEELSDEVNY